MLSFIIPLPRLSRHRANNCLAAFMDVNVFDDHPLLARFAPQLLQGLKLFAEDSHEPGRSVHVRVDGIRILIL